MAIPLQRTEAPMPLDPSRPGPLADCLLAELASSSPSHVLRALEGAYPELSSAFYDELQTPWPRDMHEVRFTTSSPWSAFDMAREDVLRRHFSFYHDDAMGIGGGRKAYIRSMHAISIPGPHTPAISTDGEKMVWPDTELYSWVGLAIHPGKRSLVYHDPTGTPPPALMGQIMGEAFKGFDIHVVQRAQAPLEGSTGLATLANLAAYASDGEPDWNIGLRLWDIRRRDARNQLRRFQRHFGDAMPNDPGGTNEEGYEYGIQRDAHGRLAPGQDYLLGLKRTCRRSLNAISSQDWSDATVPPSLRLAIANLKDAET
jgi:hypothetical protein